VVITSDKNVILDIDPPILGSLTIDGVLVFSALRNSSNLRAKNIWVRYGQLLAGNETQAFTSNIIITLYGVENDPYLIVDNDVFVGNKVFANTGKVGLYGVTPKTT